MAKHMWVVYEEVGGVVRARGAAATSAEADAVLRGIAAEHGYRLWDFGETESHAGRIRRAREAGVSSEYADGAYEVEPIIPWAEWQEFRL